MSNQPIELLSDEEEDEEEEDIEYVVERIVKHRTRGKKKEYLIKWLNYPDSDNSWEPEENVEGCKELLEEYWKNIKHNELKEQAKALKPQPKKNKVISIDSSSSSTDSDVVSVIESPKNTKKHSDDSDNVVELDIPNNNKKEQIIKKRIEEVENIKYTKKEGSRKKNEKTDLNGELEKSPLIGNSQEQNLEIDIPDQDNGMSFSDIEVQYESQDSDSSPSVGLAHSSYQKSSSLQSSPIAQINDKNHQNKQFQNDFELPNPDLPANIKDIKKIKGNIYFYVSQNGHEKWFPHKIVKSYLFNSLIHFYEKSLFLTHSK